MNVTPGAEPEHHSHTWKCVFLFLRVVLYIVHMQAPLGSVLCNAQPCSELGSHRAQDTLTS